MLTQSMTPNQISAASGPTTGARNFCAIGAIIGRMINAIFEEVEEERHEEDEEVDEDQKALADPAVPGSEVRRCSSQTPPETPRNTTEKQVEPIRMKVTMQVMRMVV